MNLIYEFSLQKIKFIFLVTMFFIFLFNPYIVYAEQNSFISVVNPIRGSDFWELENQSVDEVVKGQIEILKNLNIPVTWLIRFDVLGNEQILQLLKKSNLKQELGIFLEITPSWTSEANVSYKTSENWHFAESVFLSGYSREDRERLIDKVFEKFKAKFGFYPKSVGAWWIDAYSMNYLYEKYKIESALIVSDQYTTDNYQIWGQYFSTPYYPSKTSVLMPAQSMANKLPVVIVQWAARDPLNGYGKGVEDSTYSVQPNDYLDYHKLDTDYFSSIVDIYTQQKLNKFGHLIVGLENSYDWKKYKDEYKRQINILKDKQSKTDLNLVTMSEFAFWYKSNFPEMSPEHIIEANDPLGSDRKVVWFMNSYYRVGWFYGGNSTMPEQQGSMIRDIRQYIDGSEEMCYKESCKSLNFATFATRVLDEVTYSKKWLLDRGKINNYKLAKDGEKYTITYKNDAQLERKIEFYPRDIAVDGNIQTIDQTILKVINKESDNSKEKVDERKINQLLQLSQLLLNSFRFVLFTLFILFLGYNLVFRSQKHIDGIGIFISLAAGYTIFTFASFILGILNLRILFPYIILIVLFFTLKQASCLLKTILNQLIKIKKYKLELFIILSGVIFQGLTMFKSGWIYDFGVGFWGPTGRDGIWHQALINELTKHIPPQNPILSGEMLSSYHYFYDLLVAETHIISTIPLVDLLYRFYPIIFSLMLGVGTLLLSRILFHNKVASLASLYFVYFAGSFGWIVEFIRERHFGGESAFWVNQSVSMNLNPPFAISLCFTIAIVLVLNNISSRIYKGLLIVILTGTLIEFKAYGGIVVLTALLLLSLYKLILRKFFYFLIFIMSALLSSVLFLTQSSSAGSLAVFSPFWFIHSMIDFPDRVGWLKLSAARSAYYARGEWLKFITIEVLSIVIFVLGNLGVRALILLGFYRIFTKAFWLKEENIFLLGMGFSSFLIPLLFIQKGNPWNTIQFMYYFIYVGALFSGGVFSAIYLRQNIIIKAILILIVTVVTPINSIMTFRSGFYPLPPARLTHLELDALNFLKTRKEGVVLIPPYDATLKKLFNDPFPIVVYDSTSYVSAFSSKPVYIEDESQQEIFQTDYKKRIVMAKEFFNARNLGWSKNFLKSNYIKYVYLQKIFKKGLDESSLNINNIFENEEVVIYESHN